MNTKLTENKLPAPLQLVNTGWAPIQLNFILDTAGLLACLMKGADAKYSQSLSELQTNGAEIEVN